MHTPDTALTVLQQRLPQARPRLAVVLGSGWAEVARQVQNAHRIAYSDLPGFPLPGVQGHASDVIYGTLGHREVLLLTGRKHTYETGTPDGMKLALRTLRDFGVEVLVQTNAAGSLRSAMPPGSLMVLNDHINFSQCSPLIGESGSERFVSMMHAYDADLRTQALQVAQSRGETLHQGVYVWCLGPQFETPAEIRMLQHCGADAVGMSTVPETIIARHAGLRVLAFSLISNMGAGLSDETLSHAHTLSQAAAVSERAAGLLCAVIAQLRL